MWQVVGQTRVVSLLESGLRKGTLAHAYVLVGPAHVGKRTLALNLAQALNCERDKPPCGECNSCQRVASLKHADVRIIGLNRNGDSTEVRQQVEIGIDQIRELEHSSSLPPFEGKYKVFIIDEAELLSNEAANCLLKTLEEPVGKVVFLLLTTNDKLLPATVISRCQRLELLPLPVCKVEEALISNWGIGGEKAGLLARLSQGCLGWALSAASNEGLLQERSERIRGLLSVSHADYEERFFYSTELATQFNRQRRLVFDVLDLWLWWWRDLLLVKLGLTDRIVNVDFQTELAQMAKEYSLTQIRGFIGSLKSASDGLRRNANPQLVLEVLMLNLPGKERTVGRVTPDLR